MKKEFRKNIIFYLYSVVEAPNASNDKEFVEGMMCPYVYNQ